MADAVSYAISAYWRQNVKGSIECAHVRVFFCQGLLTFFVSMTVKIVPSYESGT